MFFGTLVSLTQQRGPLAATREQRAERALRARPARPRDPRREPARPAAERGDRCDLREPDRDACSDRPAARRRSCAGPTTRSAEQMVRQVMSGTSATRDGRVAVVLPHPRAQRRDRHAGVHVLRPARRGPRRPVARQRRQHCTTPRTARSACTSSSSPTRTRARCPSPRPKTWKFATGFPETWDADDATPRARRARRARQHHRRHGGDHGAHVPERRGSRAHVVGPAQHAPGPGLQRRARQRRRRRLRRAVPHRPARHRAGRDVLRRAPTRRARSRRCRARPACSTRRAASTTTPTRSVEGTRQRPAARGPGDRRPVRTSIRSRSSPRRRSRSTATPATTTRATGTGPVETVDASGNVVLTPAADVASNGQITCHGSDSPAHQQDYFNGGGTSCNNGYLLPGQRTTR